MPDASWDRERQGLEEDADDEDPLRSDADENEKPWCQPEDGEVVPTAIEAGLTHNESPTPVPLGGFPRVHREDPEARLQGMAVEWIQEIWSDPPNTVLLLDVFNYRYTEDDSYNRRISEGIRRRIEQVSGERNFDVVPPEADTRPGARARDLPTTWAIRGLSPDGVASALRRGVWSFRDITFFAFPRATQMTSWICMLEGFLDGNTSKIRAAVIRALTEPDMAAWIVEMTRLNPDFRGMTADERLQAIQDSVRVEPMQMGNGNFVVNVFVRPPTRDVREWRRWAGDLRSRRYRSFANGTGRVRYVARCSGCHGVSHLTHICPYPRLRGWNGPLQGEGVFGELRRDQADTRSTGQDRQQRRRDDSDRGRGSWSTPRAPRERDGRDGESSRRRGGGNGRGRGGSSGGRGSGGSKNRKF